MKRFARYSRWSRPYRFFKSSTPRVSPHYFFWTGEGKRDTAEENWRRSLRKLFALAKVTGGHPHRFRDTFAVELLLAGVPLERVSVLLGHSSVRVTEKHYSPIDTRMELGNRSGGARRDERYTRSTREAQVVN